MFKPKELKGLGMAGVVVALALGPASYVLASQTPQFANGAAVYAATCVACHGENGKGTIPGVPNFTKKKSPLSKSDQELVQSVLYGFQSPGSFMEMPARGGNPVLTEQDVLDVVSYLRGEFQKK